MKIEISKKAAQALVPAIWLLAQTCNLNKPDKLAFEANKKVMDELEIDMENLSEIVDLLPKLRKKFNIK